MHAAQLSQPHGIEDLQDVGKHVSAPQGNPAGRRGDKPPRIRLWPVTLRLLLALILPVSAALLADLALGTMPWLTLATSLVCIPLATVIVGNATLRDFERVVARVAPYEAAENAAAEPATPEAAVEVSEAAPTA